MKKFLCIILVVAVISVIGVLIFGGNVNHIEYLEDQYKENPTNENLFELCKAIFTDEEDELIIKYLPVLIKNPEFDNLINDYLASDYWINNLENKMTLTALKNMYIDRYIYACYTELEYEDFKERFIEIFPYFVYEKDSNDDYTIYLQSHFWKTTSVDKKLTRDYIDVLRVIYKNEDLPLDLRKDGYRFIIEWYGSTGAIILYCEVTKEFNSIADKSEITMTDEQADRMIQHTLTNPNMTSNEAGEYVLIDP